jgi:hypothetical protein
VAAVAGTTTASATTRAHPTVTVTVTVATPEAEEAAETTHGVRGHPAR